MPEPAKTLTECSDAVFCGNRHHLAQVGAPCDLCGKPLDAMAVKPNTIRVLTRTAQPFCRHCNDTGLLINTDGVGCANCKGCMPFDAIQPMRQATESNSLRDKMRLLAQRRQNLQNRYQEK